jgi:hypothetical protein
MKCEFCKNNFVSKTSLNNHQRSAKYCLKLQGVECKYKYNCDSCKMSFHKIFNLNRHRETCKSNDIMYEYIGKNKKLEEKVSELNNIITIVSKQLEEYKLTICNLQDKLENVALKAIERPFDEETYMNNECDDIEEYKLSSLNIGEGYNIEHREEDGYINVTNLCKADGKNFSNWRRLDKTQAFLKVLSSSMLIHINELIRYKMGSIHERATWVHPHVAINIAQWISPEFDVKVSAWVYEVMMTGKVDISNTKTYKKIQKENKTLKNKYVKRHRRTEYKEKYVIYILTTKLMQKDRRYIMGKATNLTSRLSTYNKSDEHRVVYHQGCGDEETMSLVENMVFHHLHKYREQANRERFILPENEEIILFSNWIKKSIEYCKKKDL